MVSGVSAKISRGSYEETASVEFKLHSVHADVTDEQNEIGVLLRGSAKAVCMLIFAEKKEKEKQKKRSTTPTDGGSARRGAAGRHISPAPGQTTARRSPSPDCYRRRSPAARAPAAEKGAVGGAGSPLLEVSPSPTTSGSLRKPGSPALPRRSRRSELDDYTANLSPRSG